MCAVIEDYFKQRKADVAQEDLEREVTNRNTLKSYRGTEIFEKVKTKFIWISMAHMKMDLKTEALLGENQDSTR